MPQTSGALDDIGGVEPAAEADLDDAGVGGRAGEGEEGGGGGRLEEADLHALGRVERLGEQGGERVVLDQPAGEADALVEADQVRAGIDVGGRAPPPRSRRAGRRRSSPCRWCRRHGGPAAARARDCRAGRAGRAIRSSPRMSRAGREHGQPVELGLDGGMIGRRLIRHGRHPELVSGSIWSRIAPMDNGC